MSGFAIKTIATVVLACFTLVATADVSACCHHRRRCGGGGCGGYGGGCGGYGGGCGGYGGGCGGGYCYGGGYGYGGYYTATPAPLFPRLAALRNRNVAPSVVMTPTPVVVSAAPPVVASVNYSLPSDNLVLTTAGTENALTRDGGGNQ